MTADTASVRSGGASGSGLARRLGVAGGDRLPAFLVIAGIPLTFSIAVGIGPGVLGFVVTMAVTRRAREVHPLMWTLVPLFGAVFLSDWLSREVV